MGRQGQDHNELFKENGECRTNQLPKVQFSSVVNFKILNLQKLMTKVMTQVMRVVCTL